MAESKGILTFKKDVQHYTALVNGAYGGIIGDGMSDLIEVHLFCETNPEIERIEVDVASGQELARFPEEVTKERIAKFTALMTIRTAQSLAEWLLKNVAEAKKAQAESETVGESGKVH